jgi:hypothetical protein
MAKTIEQLEQELGKVSQDTRRAYDILNSKARDGRFYEGLYRQLDIAQNTLKKKGVFESARIEAEATIKNLEPRIKAAEAEYKKFQEQKNVLSKELKVLKTAEQTKKTNAATAKGAANVYKDALDELGKADLSLEGYKGNEKYIAAYTKAQEAYNTLTKAGVTPNVALPEAKIVIPPTEETKLGADGKPVKEPSITEFITTITDPKNKQLLIDVQKDLAKNFKYTGPVDGSPSTNFVTSLQKAYETRGLLPEAWRGTDFRTFLSSPNVAGTSGTAGAGSGSQYDPYGTLLVWDKTKTKSELTTLFSNLGLDRDPTDKEVNSIYAQLDKKQKEQKATVTKYKMINGVRTAVTTPGFNQAEFVTDLIKGTQEYKDTVAKKGKQEESKNLISAQTLQNTASKNGITLSPEQLDSFSSRVKKGEDISLVQNDIRKLAAIGQPDNIKKLIDSGIDLSTVYDPYKKLMGSVLEINPNSIELNDPTLRMAIGPDKEMSLYEYQRALRKDNRWQYTDQARGEAADVATTVLKDFGFMG